MNNFLSDVNHQDPQGFYQRYLAAANAIKEYTGFNIQTL